MEPASCYAKLIAINRQLPAGQRRPSAAPPWQRCRLRHRPPRSGPCQAQPRVILYDAYDRHIPYEQAWQFQKGLVEEVCASSTAAAAATSAEDAAEAATPIGSLVLLQHPPVYTLGAAATEGNLKFDVAAPPLPLYRTERGGEVTYHGPGQLVMYPILDLRRAPLHADLHWYLRQLEEVVIRALDVCSGLQGERISGLTGVWVHGQKVAAIGVRATRWVTYHGLALNVATDLAPFHQIVPCGITDRSVASVAGLLAAAKQGEQELQRKEQQQQQQQASLQQQQEEQARAQLGVGARTGAWDDPLAASLSSELAAPPLVTALEELGEEWAQRQAAEAALIEEYRHGLLEAFQQVFCLELQAAEPADIAALLLQPEHPKHSHTPAKTA